MADSTIEDFFVHLLEVKNYSNLRLKWSRRDKLCGVLDRKFTIRRTTQFRHNIPNYIGIRETYRLYINVYIYIWHWTLAIYIYFKYRYSLLFWNFRKMIMMMMTLWPEWFAFFFFFFYRLLLVLLCGCILARRYISVNMRIINCLQSRSLSMRRPCCTVKSSFNCVYMCSYH